MARLGGGGGADGGGGEALRYFVSSLNVGCWSFPFASYAVVFGSGSSSRRAPSSPLETPPELAVSTNLVAYDSLWLISFV